MFTNHWHCRLVFKARVSLNYYKMVGYSHREYYSMVRLYAICGGNLAEASRRYAEPGHLRTLRAHGIPNPQIPEGRTILKANQRLLETGTTSISREGRGYSRKTVRTEENILRYFERHPRGSTRQAGRHLGVNQTYVWHVLRRNNRRLFHSRRVKAIHDNDPDTRINFCRWLLANQRANILWTAESQFGMVNSQNEHSGQVSVNVWAGMINGKIIGPVFVKERLRGSRRLKSFRRVVTEILDDVPLGYLSNLYFQHDRRPARFETSVRSFLDEEFPDRWIGRGGPINWPPRSPDLTPVDFFLWSEVERRVDDMTKFRNVNELKRKIKRVFREVKTERSAVLRSLNLNIIRRAELCVQENGRHFEHLLQYSL